MSSSPASSATAAARSASVECIQQVSVPPNRRAAPGWPDAGFGAEIGARAGLGTPLDSNDEFAGALRSTLSEYVRPYLAAGFWDLDDVTCWAFDHAEGPRSTATRSPPWSARCGRTDSSSRPSGPTRATTVACKASSSNWNRNRSWLECASPAVEPAPTTTSRARRRGLRTAASARSATCTSINRTRTNSATPSRRCTWASARSTPPRVARGDPQRRDRRRRSRDGRGARADRRHGRHARRRNRHGPWAVGHLVGVGRRTHRGAPAPVAQAVTAVGAKTRAKEWACAGPAWASRDCPAAQRFSRARRRSRPA